MLFANGNAIAAKTQEGDREVWGREAIGNSSFHIKPHESEVNSGANSPIYSLLAWGGNSGGSTTVGIIKSAQDQFSLDVLHSRTWQYAGLSSTPDDLAQLLSMSPIENFTESHRNSN